MDDMHEAGSADRRRFLKRMSTLALAAPLLAAAGCGKEPTTTKGNAGTYEVEITIGENHGHRVTITEQQLDKGEAVTLTLTEGGGHTHSVSLSAEQVRTIADGGTVSVESTSDSFHTHTVTFS